MTRGRLAFFQSLRVSSSVQVGQQPRTRWQQHAVACVSSAGGRLASCTYCTIRHATPCSSPAHVSCSYQMTTPPPHARTHRHAALWLVPSRACHAHPRRYTNNQSPKPVHLFVTCGRGPSGVEPPHVAVSKVCTELSKILLDGLARPCIVRMDLRSSHLAFAVDRVAIETLVDRLVRSPGVTQISYNRNDFHPLSVAKIYICMVDRCHAPKFRR